jgi:ubiquinone/menaquinone biosynthesis C-methylase UbiE
LEEVTLNDIKRSVEATYDSIAPFFVKHRDAVWPPTRSLLDQISPCRIADIGCGTGRLVAEALRRGSVVTGVDISSGQLETARRYLEKQGCQTGFTLVKGDMENLPFDDDSFEAVFLIASIHHLEKRTSRIKGLTEASRILSPGGILQVSAWSWDQHRFREKHLDRIHGNRDLDYLDGPGPGDFYVPWKDGKIEKRFYHLYGPGELEEEISETDLVVLRSFFDGRNHWLEASKK